MEGMHTRHISDHYLTFPSYLQQFLELGSLVRRLEVFVHGLRDRYLSAWISVDRK